MKRIVISLTTAIALAVPLTAVLSSHADAGPRRATRVALHQVGEPYVYGANGPNSFDCSGLVQYAFRHAGYPHMPRTAQQQYNRTRHISRSNMRRGDLLFYHNSSGHVFHVAVFRGRGRGVVEAANPRDDVRRAPVWRAPRWAGTMRR